MQKTRRRSILLLVLLSTAISLLLLCLLMVFLAVKLLMLWFVSWLPNMPKTENLIRWFVALCTITLALPFLVPLTAALFQGSHIPSGFMSSPACTLSILLFPSVSPLIFLFLPLSASFLPSPFAFFLPSPLPCSSSFVYLYPYSAC